MDTSCVRSVCSARIPLQVRFMVRGFFSRLSVSVSIVLLFVITALADERKPNILIVTVDDMSADSIGAFGCKLPGTSPSIDRFAQQALKFEHAHVQVGNCMPGRNIMWSGLMAHANGVEGFVQNTDPDYPVLCDLAKRAGYFAAIRGKVTHSTPYHPYAWDAVLDQSADGKKFHIKDAASYGESTRMGIDMAEEAKKPFCLMVNISDPHKPFYSQRRKGETSEDPHVPSRVFSADEVPVPGFLFEDKGVREELALYYSSVRRADDAFAEVMKALVESGHAQDTFVMFLSDHGMPLPFAKTQLYHHSTHTPLMIRWPGVTDPGSVDDQHMISAVDFLPTLLDVMGTAHPTPEKLHGRSFEPVLRGETQPDRDFVVLQYNENSGGSRHPMRGIQTREALYLYNPWSDGQRKFATATTGTTSYRRMVERSRDEARIAARLDLFDHRVPEEFFVITEDPDCLNNLVGHTDYRQRLDQMRQQLADALAAVGDPVAPLLANVEDLSMRQAFMAEQDARSETTRRMKQQRKKAAAERSKSEANRRTLRKNALSLQVPSSVTPGDDCVVTIRLKLPPNLGPQKLHVTLKNASTDPSNKVNTRIDREVLTVDGDKPVSVRFQVPEKLSSDAVRFAAFIGDDFENNMIYVNSKTIRVGAAIGEE